MTSNNERSYTQLLTSLIGNGRLKNIECACLFAEWRAIAISHRFTKQRRDRYCKLNIATREESRVARCTSSDVNMHLCQCIWICKPNYHIDRGVGSTSAMGSQSSNEVEETLKRINSHKGMFLFSQLHRHHSLFCRECSLHRRQRQMPAACGYRRAWHCHSQWRRHTYTNNT